MLNHFISRNLNLFFEISKGFVQYLLTLYIIKCINTLIVNVKNRKLFLNSL